MKTLSFILQTKAALPLVDWDTLLNEQDPATLLILITEPGGGETLTASAKNQFTTIIELAKFEFNPVREAMDKVFAQHFQAGDRSRIGTLHEFHVLTAAQLREHYQTSYNMQGPGAATIQNFRNKLLMKEVLGAKGVRIPRYTRFDPSVFNSDPEVYLQSVEQLLGFPMFVKPVDSGGSINTAYIDDIEALRKWCRTVAESDSNQIYEIDEFIDGTLFHCDSVIQEGKIRFTLIGQYLHPNADALSGKPLATMTLNPESADYEALQRFTEEALGHFPALPDGITHMEVFKNQKGELIFLEVAARAPGGVAPEMHKIRTGGVDIRQLHLRINLGLDISEAIMQLNDRSKWGPFASMFQLVAPALGGTISKLNALRLRGGDFKTQWLCKEGEVINPAISIANVIASTLFWNTNYEEFEQDFHALDQQQMIEIAPLEQACVLSTIATPEPDTSCNAEQRSSLMDRAVSSIVSYAENVVVGCPNYFPEGNLNYWGNANPTFFSQTSANSKPANQCLNAEPSPSLDNN